MKSVLALSLLISAMSVPAFALSDQSSHYADIQNAAPLADPDEKDNFSSANDFQGAPSGREQQLLGGLNHGQQTYGFASPGGSLQYGFGQGSTYLGSQSR
jgi:hypothetical protein